MERLNLNIFGQLEQPFDPMDLAKMKADTINSTPGNMTGVECPKCLNRGSIAIPKEDGGVVFRDCDCMKTRKCIWEMEKSGLKNIIREKTFEAYKDEEMWQKRVKKGAKEFAENPTGWLLFCGQPGSGKMHLCTAICRHLLLNGAEVRYMPWREKISEIKGMSLDNERRTEILHGLKTAPILYIDDLYKTGRSADGSCNPSVADIGLAFEIVNQRYINHLTTIISTEKTPQELVEIEEATGSRIIEMAGKNVYSIARDIKRNYRLRGVTTL